MVNKKIATLLTGLIATLFIGVFGINNNVFADIPENSSLAKKVLYSGVNYCYVNSESSGGLKDKIKLNDFVGLDSLASLDEVVPKIGLISDKKSCKDIFNETAVKIPKVITPNTVETRKKELNKISYKQDGTSADDNPQGCMTYYAKFDSYLGADLRDIIFFLFLARLTYNIICIKAR